MPELLDHKLLFVTGKGGVGKTTVAAAIASLPASRAGGPHLRGRAQRRPDPRLRVRSDPVQRPPRATDNLVAMSMDTEAALREYLRTVARVPTVGRIGPVARAFDFVATAAPGIREILTVGKLCFEVREGHYDLVVVDASSTGNVVGQLAAPTGINELIRVGIVKAQTDWILEILGDPVRTGAVLVTTPEEMPVTEAVDLAGRLESETPVRLSCVVANRVLPELFGRSEEQVFNELVRPARLDLLARELKSSREDVEGVMAAARLAVTVRRDGAADLERLRAGIAPEVPLLYLPYLFARAHGLRAVRQVAHALSEELVT